jgi:hypothetical protein
LVFSGYYDVVGPERTGNKRNVGGDALISLRPVAYAQDGNHVATGIVGS